MWTKDDLHIRPRPRSGDGSGLIHNVTPDTAKWRYTSFAVYMLTAGQTVSGLNEDEETCAVVIRGAARFTVDDAVLGVTGHRPAPFDRKPWAMYVPLGSSWQVQAVGDLEIAFCSAPARKRKSALMIAPGDFPVETRGTGNNVRHVIDLLPADQDLADRLLVVEAITPPGNSSSYPPHKHDEDNLPTESKLEEVYYHRINPPSGFAFQRVYTDNRDLDISMAVSDRDVVLVPKGYHPVVAPHGYELYYLNAMAGPARVWKTNPDPDHAWLLSDNERAQGPHDSEVDGKGVK